MLKFLICVLTFSFSAPFKAHSSELKVGDMAPTFQLKTHEGKEFKLEDRRGKWTILYFYPKAETPGCTKQACAFRDSIKKVRDLDADVFGVSADSVEDISKFHKHHDLNFTLLSNADLKVIEAYGAKSSLLKMAKRWTYVIDPQLKIRHIDQKVDPVMDVEKTSAVIKDLQAKK
jgi:thioredoxin-dependent peroxiredoxin